MRNDLCKMNYANACCAIVIDSRGRLLLQHRDDLPHIWYPDTWCFFGGAVEPNESDEVAVLREFVEETALEAKVEHELMRFTFDVGPIGGVQIYRAYYFLSLLDDFAEDSFPVREGRLGRAVSIQEAAQLNWSPYDRFCLDVLIDHRYFDVS